MKTYFAGIRRWSAVMAFGVPLLFWFAFVLLALGARYWSVVPWVLALIAAVSFPPGLMNKALAKPGPGEPPWLVWLARLGGLTIYIWLATLPEMRALYERVLSGAPLRHWLLITASLVLLTAAILRRFRAVNALSDQDIYDFFKTGKETS